MIQLKIDGVRYTLDKKTKRYVRKKIGKLDRFLPPKARQGLHAQVTLIQNNSQPKERYKCEVRLHVKPKDLFVAPATVVNMYSAIDQAEDKLVGQLRKYKSKKLDGRQNARRLKERMRRFGHWR